jgi:hydroxymethylbilane synthase
MTDPSTLHLGTRGSPLALRQAEEVRRALETSHPGLKLELVIIKTHGDHMKEIPLPQVGVKGIFAKEIEEALLRGEVDVAVHSLKDLPTVLPAGLCIGAVTKREDPRDALISRGDKGLSSLPQGARVGTSSLRRRAQLLAHRPDLTVVPLRGNLDTRLRKLGAGEVDALVVAAAGLIRMGWRERVSEFLPFEISLPAPGQGALALEMRSDGEALTRSLDHLATRQATEAERAFLGRLEGGCQVPIGAFGQIEGGTLRLSGCVASPDGRKIIRGSVKGSSGAPQSLGEQLAEQLLTKGAAEILGGIRSHSGNDGAE